MNRLIINGNLTKDIDLQFAPGTGTAVFKNTVASRRKFKDKNTNQYESDFIPFTAFGKNAEFIANNFVKGQGILLECRMQSGSYEKDGIKHYTLEAVAENIEFFGAKKDNNQSDNKVSEKDTFGNEEYEEDITPVNDDSMPF